MQVPELGAYGLQAWLVSVTVAAMGLTKVAFWVRSSKANGKLAPHGSEPGILLARDVAKFESEILGLTRHVIKMTEQSEARQGERESAWRPGLQKMIEGQTQIMRVLDSHTTTMNDHLKYSKQMWIELVGQMEGITRAVGKLDA